MKKLNVLFVDDEPMILRSLRAAYKLEFNVFLASGAKQARETLANKDNKIDVVVTDERMDEEAGSDLIDWLRSHMPDMGVIMLTGASEINKLKARLLVEVVAKPWGHNELVEAIKQASENSKIQLLIANSLLKTKVVVLNADQQLRDNCLKMSAKHGDSDYVQFMDSQEQTFERIALMQALKAVIINATDNLSELRTIVQRVRSACPSVTTIAMASPATARTIGSSNSSVNADQILVKPMSIVRFIPAMENILSLKVNSELAETTA